MFCKVQSLNAVTSKLIRTSMLLPEFQIAVFLPQAFFNSFRFQSLPLSRITSTFLARVGFRFISTNFAEFPSAESVLLRFHTPLAALQCLYGFRLSLFLSSLQGLLFIFIALCAGLYNI